MWLEVVIKSPIFMVLVAVMYLALVPEATKAMRGVLHGSYWMFRTRSTSGVPSGLACLLVSTFKKDNH